MSDITRRHRDGGGWEEQAGYSRAVRRFGHIAVSGTTATAADGRALHPGDTYGQALVALQRASAAMQALGGRLDDVVRTRVFLAPGADWEGAARAHAEVLGSVAPANTMVYVAGLIGDGFLVEVELEAETPVDVDRSR
ncbi:MAG TPA: Rid family hydrolase [Candidatus Micrarchaeaceae archaeon]|nr:Rid family hydrolase [Candidatus Micrarchaeaceae archaeon]